jgi:hypothetical protein
MFKFLTNLFAESDRTSSPKLKASLTLNGMEERATPSLVGGADITPPPLVAHVTQLEIHEFNPQPDPPARVVNVFG